MSTYGFESYDANGKLQFNTEMATYSIRKSGSGVTQTRFTGNTAPSSFTVPTGSAYADTLVAVQVSGGYGAAPAGNYYSNKAFACSAPVGTAFNWFIFDQSTKIPRSNGWGLEVYNTSGQITFSSDVPPMQALTVLGSPPAGYWDNNGQTWWSDPPTVTYSGKKLAVASFAFAGHRHAGYPMDYGGGGPVIRDDPGGGIDGGTHDYRYNNDGKLYGGALTDNYSTATSVLVSYDDVQITLGNDPTPPPDWVIPLKMFVIDVTNIPVGYTWF